MTAVLGRARISGALAQLWARDRGATTPFVQLAVDYWAWAEDRGGVRPEVAYAQAAKETGFGRFGGSDPVFSASEDMNNWCGLKTTDGRATARFVLPATGVVAHLDHLALYAGAVRYPRSDTPDPRHFGFLHATVESVEDLGGEIPADGVPDWAPSPDYGVSIVRDYLTDLMTA